MKSEWLFYVPARSTPVGTAPAFYAVATDPADCRELREMGGRLSNNWRAYYAEADEAHAAVA